MDNIVHDQVHSSQPVPWAHTVLPSTLCMHWSVNKELLYNMSLYEDSVKNEVD